MPARVYYNKLVRDGIPEIIRAKGEDFSVRTLTDRQEFVQELFKKIQEEANALAHVRSREDFLQEYIDLSLVIETLLTELGVTAHDVALAREANIKRKGLYEDRLFLLWSDDVSYKSNESPQGIKQ
jgi:predicted house-cleaning noncanonical NTP pyrophosphatase (MazG superfamily)